MPRSYRIRASVGVGGSNGLLFVAVDLDWQQGRGPEVRGTGEAIALAAVGRPVVLDELTGDGLPEL